QRPRKAAASPKTIPAQEVSSRNSDNEQVAILDEPADVALPDGRVSVDAPGPSVDTSVDAPARVPAARPQWRIYLLGAGCVLIMLLVLWRMATRDVIAHSGPAADSLSRLLPGLEGSGTPVRLVAGCSSAGYTDQGGNHWDCDR